MATILAKVKSKIKCTKRFVFTRADFADIAEYDQIGRALRMPVAEGSLLKIGYGLYTTARKNRINGKIMPDNPNGSDGVLIEALELLGVKYKFDKLSMMNMSGESTQIPAKIGIIPENKRFKRKITVGSQRINAS